MADINTLLGLEMGDEQKMQALADKLRGQQRAGTALSLSTSQPIADFGRNFATQASDSAQRGGVLSQAMAKRQAASDAAAEAEKVRLSERDQDYNRGLTKAKLAQTSKQQLIKDREAVKPEKPKEWETGTGSERTKLEKMGSDAAVYESVFGAYKPEFSNVVKNPFTDTEYEGMPWISSIENSVARNAPILANEHQEDKAKWWSDFNKYYANIARHGLFGSALTKDESKLWKASNINESMTDRQIQAGLDKMREVLNLRKSKAQKNKLESGWKPSYVNAALGMEGGEDNVPENISAPDSDDLSIVPEGITPEEWDTLSDSGKRDYYDYYL